MVSIHKECCKAQSEYKGIESMKTQRDAKAGKKLMPSFVGVFLFLRLSLNDLHYCIS